MDNVDYGKVSSQSSSPPERRLDDISNHITSLSDTPRRRKTPQVTPAPVPPTIPALEPKWPRFKTKVSVEEIIGVTQQIFGYKPKDWQLQTFQKIAEGHNTISIAGTGYGKSLIFALLAIVAQLTHTKGTVIVVCPLKSLEMDQASQSTSSVYSREAHLVFKVKQFHMAEGVTREDGTEVKINAVAINEDNKDKELFTNLKNGAYHICYASPECLLRNNDFKKLFRLQKFRHSILTLVVDEAHVIEDWKDTFRKDYDELKTLRVIAGSEIPWAALTATCSTMTFKVIYESLGMADSRPFWGIDMGADRPNVAQWVRRMEYSKNSMGDLLAFVPLEPESLSAAVLPKTVFYFKTRSLARKALRKCRRLLAPDIRKYLGLFTATNSEEHKNQLTERFKTGQTRWVFATLALGMGLDVPDIERVVIYGVCPLSEMYQKGGRAGHDPKIRATMIWLVEGWAFDIEEAEDTGAPSTGAKLSKKQLDEMEKRDKLEPAAQAYINCSKSNTCHREYICTHFRPQPCFLPQPNTSSGECGKMTMAVDELANNGGLVSSPDASGESIRVSGESITPMTSVMTGKKHGPQTWVVLPQSLAKGPDCGCSSVTCRANPTEPVGQLDERARAVIDAHLLTLSPRLNTMNQVLPGRSI